MKEVKILIEKHADGYVAYPVGLKGVVVGQGDTYEEALAEVERAKAAWLEAARSEGKPIPTPSYRPVIYQATS
jgi:predicted RNase H-like HicB family nuclease